MQRPIEVYGSDNGDALRKLVDCEYYVLFYTPEVEPLIPSGLLHPDSQHMLAELGMAMFMGKRIIAMKHPGTGDLPRHIAWVANKIITVDLYDYKATADKIREAMDEIEEAERG